MLRNVFQKVLWLGRGTATAMGIAVMLALVLGLAGAALAAVPGDPFKLGRQNTIDAVSRMVGTVNDAMLRIDNDSNGASATALELRVEPGQPPMEVDSDTKVGELNADKLDGKTAGAFLGADDKAVDAAHADRADRADDAANADQLDGLDSSLFSRANHRHDDRYYTEGEADARYVSKSNHTKSAHDALGINATELDGLNSDEIGVNDREVVQTLNSPDSDSPKQTTATCSTGNVIVGTGYEISGGDTGSSPDEETDVVVTRLDPALNRVTVEAYEEEPTSDAWRLDAIAICARYGSSGT